MQRPQKTAKVGCPCEGMLETKSNKGACSVVLTETDREDGAENLLERILDRNNLNQAYLKVKKNGGSAGIDGMTVEEMLPYLKIHREELLEALRSERYKPKAVKRVEIPKPDGGKRMLGVPITAYLRTALFGKQLRFQTKKECTSSNKTGIEILQ